MEARWILAFIGGRALSPLLKASFFVLGSRFAGAALGGGGSTLVSPASTPSRQQRQEACGSGVVFENFLCLWDLRIVKELHRQFFLLLRLRDECGSFDPFVDILSATNHVRPTQGGAAAAARHQHGLEVASQGSCCNFCFSWGALYCLVFLLMPESYSHKKKILT
jgi:hypothetical protein